jgi:phosphoadenosine phosphosulfate reductase
MTAPTTTRARAFRGTHTAGRSPEELRELVSHVGAELELAPAEHIIEWAVATFGDRFCVTSSMADAVLADIASRVAPGIDVVFLDTGYHFAETIGTADAVGATMDVNLIPITPVHDGYPSIGCAPCTRRVAPGEDPRSGRWAGTHKTECGIHS